MHFGPIFLLSVPIPLLERQFMLSAIVYCKYVLCFFCFDFTEHYRLKDCLESLKRLWNFGLLNSVKTVKQYGDL